MDIAREHQWWSCLETKSSRNILEIYIILSYPVGATVKDRSRHTVRECTRVGPNQAVGLDRVARETKPFDRSRHTTRGCTRARQNRAVGQNRVTRGTEPVARWRRLSFGRQGTSRPVCREWRARRNRTRRDKAFYERGLA